MKTAITVLGIGLLLAGVVMALLPAAWIEPLSVDMLKLLIPVWTPLSYGECAILALSSAAQLVVAGLLFVVGVAIWFGLSAGSSQQGDITIGLFTSSAITLFGGGATACAIGGVLRALYFFAYLTLAKEVVLTNAGFQDAGTGPVSGWSVVGGSAAVEDVDDGRCLHLSGSSFVSAEQMFNVPQAGMCRFAFRIFSSDSTITNFWIRFRFHKGGQSLDSVDIRCRQRVLAGQWNRIISDLAVPAGIEAGTICLQVDGGKEYWIDDVRILL